MPFANENRKPKIGAGKFLSCLQENLGSHKYLAGAAVLLLCAVFFLAGSWYGQRRPSKPGSAEARKILHYVDPMNPAHTSPEPGLAPCGMKLEPVYADGEGNAPDPTLPPGTLKVTPQKQQLIGVRVAPAGKAPYTHMLRALGKVAVDETRIYRMNAAIDGWIKEVYNNSTGSVVKKDETLATFYSPEFLGAEQAYIFSRGSLDRFRATGIETPEQIEVTKKSIQQYVDGLRNLGMSDLQIQEIEQSRVYTETIRMVAPATSFILARNVSPGQRYTSGTEWYRLADLSRVWILADLYENEAQYIRPGEKVRITYPCQKKTFQATVSQVLPVFDPASRTLKVRLEVDNPDFALRPDMFVDVEFPIQQPPAVNVPVDAVLDSGLKQTVFVDRGNGFFEPRKVKTGWRLGDRVEITKGLKPGENIVVSGNFLLDSESRMKLAARGMYGETSPDPICGMYVDESKAAAAGLKSEFHRQTYYFCSELCQRQFDAEPARYLAKSDPDQGCCDHASKGGETQVAAEPAKGAEDKESQAPGAGHPGSDQQVSASPASREPESAIAHVMGGAGQTAGNTSTGQGQAGAAPPAGPPVAMIPGSPLPPPGKTPAMQMNGGQTPEAPLAKDVVRDIRGRPIWNQAMPTGGTTAMAPGPAGTAAKPPALATPMGGIPANSVAPGPKDPVCGMVLEENQIKNTPWKSEFHGQTYYFCSEKCKGEFDRNPERHLTGKERGAGAIKQTMNTPPTQAAAGGPRHD